MKRILFILLFAMGSLFANAQSGSTNLTATPTILGGDGTGTVASIQWTATGPAGSTFSNPIGLTTTLTVTVPGQYTITATVKDNLGNTGISSVVIPAYKAQGVKVDISASSPGIIIK